MPSHDQRLPVGVCIYGMTYTTGLAGAGTSRVNPAPMDATAFLHQTHDWGLQSVEAPVHYLAADRDPARLSAFREQADELGLAVVVAGPAVLRADWESEISAAATLGARTIRCTLSGVLCGDRSQTGGLAGWHEHLDAVVARLRQVMPMAADHGIRLAMENHQDATSWDLVRICERVGSDNLGVTLDTGNPLAVGEDVLAFARRVLPRLFHVHFKDYAIHGEPWGFRLVRTALGEGVVDFPRLLELLSSAGDLQPSIELAALHERSIRLLDEQYWAGFEPRDIAEVLPVLRLWREREVTGDWRTPWEAGRDDELAAYERSQMERSIAHLRSLLSEDG